MKRYFPFFLSVLSFWFVFVFVLAKAQADYFLWNGGSGAYSTGSNWTSVSGTATGHWVKSGTNNDFTGTTTVNNDTLFIQGELATSPISVSMSQLTLGSSASNASLIIGNANVSLSNNGGHYIGNASSSSQPSYSAAITLESGGVLSVNSGSSFFRLGQTSPASLTINQGGKFVLKSGTILTGRGAYGKTTINIDGGVMDTTAGTIYLGGYVGYSSDVAGAEAYLKNGAIFAGKDVYIGATGAGLLEIASGSQFTSTNVYLGGSEAASSGTLNILSSGTATVSDTIYVGGNSTVTVDGADATMTTIKLGQSTGNGTLIIRNGTVSIGKTWERGIFLGSTGEGHIIVNEGGLLDSRTTEGLRNFIRISDSGKGSITVNNGGEFLANQVLLVGRRAEGLLDINGGHAENTEATYVSGYGSTDAGTGTILVRNGGSMSLGETYNGFGTKKGSIIVSDSTASFTDLLRNGNTSAGEIQFINSTVEIGGKVENGSSARGSILMSNSTVTVNSTYYNGCSASSIALTAIENSNVYFKNLFNGMTGTGVAGQLDIIGGGSTIKTDWFQQKSFSSDTIARFLIAQDGVSPIQTQKVSTLIGGTDNTISGVFTAELASGFSAFNNSQYDLVVSEKAFTMGNGSAQYNVSELRDSAIWDVSQSGTTISAQLKESAALGVLDMSKVNDTITALNQQSGYFSLKNQSNQLLEFTFNVAGEETQVQSLLKWLNGETISNTANDSLFSYLDLNASLLADENAISFIMRADEDTSYLGFDLTPFNEFLGLSGADAFTISAVRSYNGVPEPASGILMILGICGLVWLKKRF